nr:helix-turn-helix domain-containing protein [Streptomyces sp. F001]
MDHNSNVQRTAQDLGISRATMYRKMRRYGIVRRTWLDGLPPGRRRAAVPRSPRTAAGSRGWRRRGASGPDGCPASPPGSRTGRRPVRWTAWGTGRSRRPGRRRTACPKRPWRRPSAQARRPRRRRGWRAGRCE